MYRALLYFVVHCYILLIAEDTSEPSPLPVPHTAAANGDIDTLTAAIKANSQYLDLQDQDGKTVTSRIIVKSH